MSHTAMRIPQITPTRPLKTAYDLLDETCKVIRNTPTKYYQGAWCAAGRDLPLSLQMTEESCGTAFCRVGILVALHDSKQKLEDIEDHGLWAERGRELLGLPDAPYDYYTNRWTDDHMMRQDVSKLFNSSALGTLVPGTHAYVQKGIQGIRAFMKKHKAHLQATPLTSRRCREASVKA